MITPEQDLSGAIRSIEPAKRTLDQVLDEFRGDVPPGRIGICAGEALEASQMSLLDAALEARLRRQSVDTASPSRTQTR